MSNHASQVEQLGWIGLGSMGLAMAKNLQLTLRSRGKPSLNFTNRTMSRGADLVSLGGIPCESIAEVVQKSTIIFTSLSDDAVLQSVVDEIVASSAAKGKLFVDTTTVHPNTSATVSKRLEKVGAQFIAAPVFGATPVAEKSQLLFVIAGPVAGVEKVKPYITGVMGRGIIELGEDVSKATLMKTTGNFMTAAMMEIVSEAHVFAEKTGLGNDNLEALIAENFGPLAFSMSQRLTTGAYAPGKGQKPWSDLNLALKDVGHGIDCAEGAGTRLQVAETAISHLQRAKDYSIAHGNRPLDSSSMYGILRQDAGLDFETEHVKRRESTT